MEFVSGSALAFTNITYTVPKVRNSDTLQYEPRSVLNNVTGSFRPGTLNAIMGASGSGKTSLLDVLANRKDRRFMTGQVLLDGQVVDPEVLKHNSGYVIQDDIVMGTLTVRENLMFSAELRLPPSVSYEEKKARVQQIIEELNLMKVAESKVGTEFVRGISGGERKRVNIGMELVTSPKVLFLDEPTTGLDASIALNVLILLKRLAEHGRTIILSIHQPRFKIFDMFDSVTLMSEGSMVYHGDANLVVSYFKSVGYECKEYNNPADYILDVVSGEEVRNGQWFAPQDYEDLVDRRARTKECQDYLKQKYQSSALFAQAQRNVEEQIKIGSTQQLTLNYRGTYAATWLHQVWITGIRTLKNVVRNPLTSIGQVVVNILVGVFVGLIFLRLDLQTNVTRTIRDRTGMLFFSSVHLMFSNFGALEIFLKERVIFVHERAAGYYCVSAFFTSKILCDMIPVRVIPIALFSVIAYFMAGLQPTAAKFFWFLFVAELQGIVAASVAFAISSLISVFALASLALTIFYVIMMVFSNYLVSIESWPEGTRWISYLSFTKYGYELFVENEFYGLDFSGFCKTGEPCTGIAALGEGQLNIDPIDKGLKILALCVFDVGLLFIAYLALLSLKKKT